MGSESYTESLYRAFAETVAGALTGKEYLPVALGAASGAAPNAEPTVQLWTGADSSPCIGVMWAKVQPADNTVTVRLFAHTTKVVANGVIAYGARVMPAAGGVVTQAGANVRCIGIKLTPGNSAAGDVIEILPIVESNGTFAN